MSFFNEVSAAYQAARNEQIRIEQERIYRATHLDSDDLRAIERVKAMCTNPELKPKILQAASRLKGSCLIYNGDDLMPLRHLNYDIRLEIIDDITLYILAHYGSDFEVSYSDQSYNGYGDSLRDATFTLEWD
jgi:hypothetical protein